MRLDSNVRRRWRTIVTLLVALAAASGPAFGQLQKPDNVAGIAIGPQDRAVTWYRDGWATSGTVDSLEWYSGLFQFAAPHPTGPITPKSPGDVAGISIACSSDDVYTWYRDRSLSVGSSDSLGRHRLLRGYFVPGGDATNIAAIGIAGNDDVYVWYRDGFVSVGSSVNLETRRARQQYTLPHGKTPADIKAIDIACSDDDVYVWYKDGTGSIGSSRNLGAHRASFTYSLPAGKTPADIVETGISKNDDVYTWFRDGSVSIGSSTDLDRHKSRYAYSLPGNYQSVKTAADIVETSISCKDGSVHTWFRDGTVTIGSADELGRNQEPRPYTLPLGKTPSDIVGIGIAGGLAESVYAWYRDGTVSIGSSDRLDSRKAPYKYSMPPGYEPRDIVGMDIACSNDHVHTWYRDGARSEGTSDDLDRYAGRSPYQLKLTPPSPPQKLRKTETGTEGVYVFNIYTSETKYFKVAWDRPTFAEGFTLELSVGEQWAPIKELGPGSASKRIDLWPYERSYCLRVRAWNRAGSSEPSNTVCY